LVELVFTPALTFYPLPQERKWLSLVSGFADERSVNPVVEIFKEAANDSPSPGGEGWGEGGRIINVVAISEESYAESFAFGGKGGKTAP
jgi:hypothetical protein